jgi:hypothetical protein
VEESAAPEAEASPKAQKKTEKAVEAPKAKKGAPTTSAADIIAMCRQQDAKK